MLDEEFASPPEAPSPSRLPLSGGDPWADRERDPTELLEEIAEAERAKTLREGVPTRVSPALVAVEVTSLPVAVRATILPVQIVERGNLAFFLASFAGDPDAIYFAYLRPGEGRPRVDPGFGQPGSRIERIGDGNYLFTLDTTGFRGGRLTWHFWGEGESQASAFGEIEIPSRPEQLL